MVEANPVSRMITGAAVAAGATLLVGCAPTPVTRTVTRSRSRNATASSGNYDDHDGSGHPPVRHR